MNGRTDTVNQIRKFNRFYTVLLGLLNKNYLDSGYCVTETRILFELHRNGRMSASQLIELLHLDKGYISRLIRGFEQRGLLERLRSSEDRRTLEIRLTPKGQAETERLIHITNRKIAELIRPLSDEDCDGLCGAMETIIKSFHAYTDF